jgi:hypothetical protein
LAGFFAAFFAFFVAIDYLLKELSATATAFSNEEYRERSRCVSAILSETERNTRGKEDFFRGKLRVRNAFSPLKLAFAADVRSTKGAQDLENPPRKAQHLV